MDSKMEAHVHRRPDHVPTTKEERDCYLHQLDLFRGRAFLKLMGDVRITDAERKEYFEDYANESARLFERRLINQVNAQQFSLNTVHEALLSFDHVLLDGGE